MTRARLLLTLFTFLSSCYTPVSMDLARSCNKECVAKKSYLDRIYVNVFGTQECRCEADLTLQERLHDSD